MFKKSIYLLCPLLLSFGTVSHCVASSTPTDTLKAYKKGVSLFKQRRLDAAEKEFQKVLSTNPNDVPSLSYEGLIFLQEHRYADAVEPLQKVVNAQPKSSNAHINLGNAFEGVKRNVEAHYQFQLASKLDPHSVSAFYDLGSVCIQMNKPQEAILAYQHAASLAPKDPDVMNNLGVAEQTVGHYAEAIKAYSTAYKLDPTSTEYAMNLALLYQQMAENQTKLDHTAAASKLWMDARIAFNHAVTDDPMNYRTREAYADTLAEMGDYDQAITQYTRISQIAPNAFHPLYSLSVLYIKERKFADANTTLNAALKIRKEDLNTLKLKAFAEYNLHNYSKAVPYYQKIVMVDPNDLASWNNLAATLQLADELPETLTTIQQAKTQGITGIRIAPLLRTAGYLYLKAGDPDSLKLALQNYIESTHDAPDDPFGYNGVGLVAQKLGKLHVALTALQRAIALKPNFDDAYNNLGVVYEGLGNLILAKRAFIEAKKINPHNNLALENLMHLGKSS